MEIKRFFRQQPLSGKLLPLVSGALAAWLWFGVASEGPVEERHPTGFPQLVSYQSFGEMCTATMSSFTAYASSLEAASPALRELGRKARRVIADPSPTFSAVAVDSKRNEVAVQDENLFQILVYDRMDFTPPQAPMTEPKRVIGGLKTKVEFNCGLYIDPLTGDIYSVSNDTVDTMVVFPRDAEGNVAPARELYTPHGTYGIAVDEANQELFLTVQHDSAVVVYNKTAEKHEAPIRLLQGDDTGLSDPHGIAVDHTRNLMFVANHGSVHRVREYMPREKDNWPLDRNMGVRGSGELKPPSISVYERTASGNARPLRVIEGPKTRLNWPAGIAVNPERGELYVANDADHSILVFRVTDQGNVAPTRVLSGPSAGIKNPTSISLDLSNGELWVSNFGSHSISAYPLDADGDTPPLRTIRAAPLGKKALGIGNPGGVAYDSKRGEILVPN